MDLTSGQRTTRRTNPNVTYNETEWNASEPTECDQLPVERTPAVGATRNYTYQTEICEGRIQLHVIPVRLSEQWKRQWERRHPRHIQRSQKRDPLRLRVPSEGAGEAETIGTAGKGVEYFRRPRSRYRVDQCRLTVLTRRGKPW